MPPNRGPVSKDDVALRRNATVERSWWPGWIWAVPIAAAMVILWLGIRALTSSGDDITITFDDVHGLGSQGAISYRGLNVGHVTKVALADDGHTVDVSATINQDAAHFVRSGTRFWLRNAHPSLSDLSSLGAVLSGPSIVMDPGPGDKATQFAGLTHQPIAPAESGQPRPYQVSFDGSVGDLIPGDPVKLRGFTVGEVKTVGFTFEAGTDALSTPVTIDLYPSLFHVQGAAGPNSPATLGALIDKLVDHGLRARLEREPPLIGSHHVVFEIDPDAPIPAQTPDAPSQIPTAPGGGIGTVVDQLKNLPIGQIAQNVLDLTHHADTLVSSPDLQNAVVELDAAVKQAKDAASQANATVTAAGPRITKLVETLERTARQLDRAAVSADRAATSAERTVSSTTSQYGLESTMRELTEAARSVRSLANFLDRHPEALGPVRI